MHRSSRLHRRWMGSHTLALLLLTADLAGAMLSYLTGGLVLPFLWSLLGWCVGLLKSLARSVLASLQFDLLLCGCLFAGIVIGLLVAVTLAEVLSSSPYRRDWRKGFVAFLITVMTAFVCWMILELILHHPHLPVIPPALPGLPFHVVSPWGVLWLSYYVLTRLIVVLETWPHALTVKGQSCSPLPSRSCGTSTQTRQNDLAALSYQVALSRGQPGSPKWDLMNRCYQLYRQALTRFDPLPLDLRVPDGFRYSEGGQQISWFKQALLLPQDWLHPDMDQVLLPEVARQLLYYNTLDLRLLEWLKGYPSQPREMLFLFLTGNFVWLPAVVKLVAGGRWEGERVLDADRFAYLLGEGMRLRQRLQREQQAHQQSGLVESSFPSLDERIEQLSALLSEEERQLSHLGFPTEMAQQPLLLEERSTELQQQE